MFELFIVATALTVGVTASWLTLRQRRRFTAAYRQAARELGLRLDEHDSVEHWQLVGRVRGHHVRVRAVYSDDDGMPSRLLTTYELRFHTQLGLGMTLRHESQLFDSGRSIGSSNTKIGDPTFDAQVNIDVGDADGLVDWLVHARGSQRRRRHIRGFLIKHRARIDDVGLQWTSQGPPVAGEEIVLRVREMALLADSLVGPFVEPEVRVASDMRTSSVGASRSAERPTAHARRKSRRENAKREHEHASIDRVLRDPLTVAETLFSQGIHGLDASECFEADFADRDVDWRGTLRRLERVTVDFVFGDGPFTRATFELHRLDADPLGSRVLRAVVQLPADEAERLRARIDQRMDFTGRLMAIDPFSRSLFVAQGEVR